MNPFFSSRKVKFDPRTPASYISIQVLMDHFMLPKGGMGKKKRRDEYGTS
jgi:hypothetical protein